MKAKEIEKKMGYIIIICEKIKAKGKGINYIRR